MIEINTEIMDLFFKKADSALDGEFAILGGSVLPLVGINTRVTLDIDLVNIHQESSGQNVLKLMEIAQELGLPIEAINQAAAFFVYRIPGWQKNLIKVFDGKRAQFYRTNSTLFVRLKISRMSETDLSDCIEMLRFAKKSKEFVDRKSLISIIGEELEKNHNSAKMLRLETLNDRLQRGYTDEV